MPLYRAWDLPNGHSFETCHTKRKGRVINNMVGHTDEHMGVVLEFESGERKTVHGQCLLRAVQRVH